MPTLILFSLVVFGTVVSLLYLLTGRPSKATRSTLSRLDAIGLGPQSPENDDQIDVRREDIFSAIPWLDELLRRLDFIRALRLMLYQAELDWSPDRFLTYMVGTGLVCALLVYLRTQSAFMAFLMLPVSGAIPYLFVRRKRNLRFEKMRERLPESLDLMVSAIRAGHSFTSAMGLASKESPEPVKREFKQCFDEQNFGLDLRTAMNNLAYRMPIRDVRMVVTAVLIQREVGGNLTEILDKVSYLIREDYRLQRQIDVHTAQGRITGYILAVLPIILGSILYVMNPEDMSLLWRRPVGVKLLEIATVMESVGLLIIRRIVRHTA